MGHARSPDLLVVDEVQLDLAGDVVFRDAYDLAGCCAPRRDDVRRIYGCVRAIHTGEHDAPERMLGLAVPTCDTGGSGAGEPGVGVAELPLGPSRSQGRRCSRG